MKSHCKTLLLILVSAVASCSKHESTPPYGQIDMRTEITAIAAQDFPDRVNKKLVYHIFSDMPKHAKYAVNQYQMALPAGNYTVPSQVIGTSDQYKALIGTYAYKTIYNSESEPFKDVLNFDLSNTCERHLWK